jgi:hypothetical protein
VSAPAAKFTRISPAELDAVIARVRAERWPSFVLLGPRIALDNVPEHLPEWLRAEELVFQSTSPVKDLAGKLRSLTDLAALVSSGNDIGEGGARAVAASLTRLISLDLSANSIGDDGARAIAASLIGLTSLNLWNKDIGDEGVRAIAASLTSLGQQ